MRTLHGQCKQAAVRAAATLTALALLTAAAWGGPLTRVFTYQGKLEQNGQPVNGAANVQFTLWDAAAGGAQIGAADLHNGVAVTDGLFTVQVNDGDEFGATAFNGNQRWLQVTVNGTPLTPRQPVAATPFACYALSAPGSGLWQAVGSAIMNTNSSFVGINRSSTVSSSEYFGIQATATGTAYGGMYIRTDSATAKPFYGYTTGTETAWTYLDGANGTWNIFNDGVRLTIEDTGDVGIGTTNPSAKLQVNQSDGDAIYADLASGTSHVAVYGHTSDAECYGVYGSNTAPFQNRYGYLGGPGRGVEGYHTDTIDGTYHWGYIGSSSYGVYASNSDGSAGNAAYFNGKVTVTGTLSKGGGSFKIDHPLDPEHKYLCHSFVESPDMMNIYNGNVTTDERGYATITMPEWFKTLNRDFRYQLTVLDDPDGDAFVQAKVAKKLKDNQFTIRTSAPRVEVSWQITGIRQDPWANKYRIPVEEEKLQHERGKYQHPELYGQPAEMGIHYHAPSATPAGAEQERE